MKYSFPTKQLISDVSTITHNQKIDLCLITGDLVKSGKKEEFENALNILINPLMEANLFTKNDIYYVPGNHEVDTDLINDLFFSGLDNLCSDYNKFDRKEYIDYADGLVQLNEYHAHVSLLNNIGLKSKRISSHIIHHTRDEKIGLVCINTAWRSLGPSSKDINNIIVSKIELNNAYNEIKDCTIKIAIMHHPVDFIRQDHRYNIEMLLRKFDIVLTGHLHEDNSRKCVYPNNETLFLAGEELSIQINGFYNPPAFHLYFVDLKKKEATIHSRRHYLERDVFDSNLVHYSEGKWKVKFGQSSFRYNLKCAIKDQIDSHFENLFMNRKPSNNDFPANAPSFVSPSFKIKGASVKEDSKQKNIDIEELLLSSKSKVLIFGREGSGKTVLAYRFAQLYLDRFDEFRKIPIVISDGGESACNVTQLFTYIHSFLTKFSTDGFSINKKQIIEEFENDGFLFIVDDFSFKNDYKFMSFLSNVATSKSYFLIFDESTLQPRASQFSEIIKSSSNLSVEISPLSKNQIRNLFQLIINKSMDNEEEFIGKTVKLFSKINLPRTPFMISLFLTLYRDGQAIEPTSKANLLTKFIEHILGRHLLSDSKRDSYDFENKCDFLGHLAYEMYEKDSFSLSSDDFDSFALSYHDSKGYNIKESKFDSLFFEVGILQKDGDNVFFKYECYLHFFLAKYCDRKTVGADWLLTSEKWWRFIDVFDYFSCFNRNSITLVDLAFKKLDLLAKEAHKNVKVLDYDPSDILEVLSKEGSDDSLETLPEEERDKITDLHSTNGHYSPSDLSKESIQRQHENLMDCMLLCGNILRNSDGMSASEKRSYLNKYVYGCVGSLVVFRIVVEYVILEVEKKLAFDKQSDSEKEKRDFLSFCEWLRTFTPIAVQESLVDLSYSSKLAKTFDSEIKDSEMSYGKLFMVIAYCEAKGPKWRAVLSEFADSVKRNPQVFAVFLIQMHIFLMLNSFGNDTDFIKEIIVNCRCKTALEKQRLRNKLDSKLRNHFIHDMSKNDE